MKAKQISFDNVTTFLPETLGDNFIVYADCADPVSQWVNNNHILYEHNVLHLLKPLLQSSSILVDIGSNIGCYSYFYKNYSNKSGYLICIDANAVNLELLKKNCQKNDDLLAINAFWTCNNGAERYTSFEELPIKEYFKDSLIKNKDCDRMHLNIKAIKNFELSRLIQEKLYVAQQRNKKCPHYFVKIDVDGNEKNSAQELFNELRSANNKFFALVEVNDTSTYYQIRNSGMIPKALLPGNNFLFDSHSEPTLSDYYLNSTLSLASTYSNRWLEYNTSEDEHDPIIDKRNIMHRDRYGVNISQCRTLHKDWWETLKDEPIFAIYQ